MKKGILCLLVSGMLVLASGAQAQTVQAVTGTIERTVFGSGEIQPLRQPGAYAQTDAQVIEWYVGMGDAVKKGDVLMKLENADLAEEMAQLEYDIQVVQNDVLYTKTHSQWVYRQAMYDGNMPLFDPNTGKPVMQKFSNEITIYAPCFGRVMAVYIEPGSDALAMYREHGCVVMLSTDGRMKVNLRSDNPLGLEYDQRVRVTGEGFEAEGRIVELSRYGTEAVVQVNSDEYPMDAPVTVTTHEGGMIGEGILEINKPMPVSAYGGTVKGLAWNVKVGEYLNRGSVISRIDWDETPLYYDNDVALWAYSKKKVELDHARGKLEKLAVVAPCDGWIASIDVGKGDSVTAGTKVITLVEDAGMQLILKIDELDIPYVKKGQSVQLSVDALPDVQLTGVVGKIAPLGNTETSVTTYDVYVELTGEVDSRVLGGMNVSGEIMVSTVSDALLVPSEALMQEGGAWYVLLESGGYQEVEVGVMSDTQVQILSGLSEGAVLVY